MLAGHTHCISQQKPGEWRAQQLSQLRLQAPGTSCSAEHGLFDFPIGVSPIQMGRQTWGLVSGTLVYLTFKHTVIYSFIKYCVKWSLPVLFEEQAVCPELKCDAVSKEIAAGSRDSLTRSGKGSGREPGNR